VLAQDICLLFKNPLIVSFDKRRLKINVSDRRILEKIPRFCHLNSDEADEGHEGM